MNKHLIAGIMFPVCALAHHILFWGEKMGVNTLFFASVMIGALFFLHPESTRSKPAIAIAVCVMLTALLVVWNNSLLSKVMHIISFVVLIGFIQGRELRFVFFAFCLGVASLFEMRLKFLREVISVRTKNSPSWRLISNMQTMAFVAPVFLLFFGLYAFANEKFAEISSNFLSNLWTFLIENFSLSRIISLVMSILIAGSMLWKTSVTFFQKIQERQTFFLLRRRPERRTKPVWWSIIALKKEHRTALLLVGLLNLLLITVNIVDICYVWFDEVPGNPLTLKQYVHEGTYLLIAAILLAMAVLLIFFRGNLNFLQENKTLKFLSYAWIAQNAVLAVSVGIRNWRYIEACGLAYKRIGVFVFLALVLFGLSTMFIKISKRRSFYYLLFYNGWVLYIVLLLTACVNWDVYITRYNIFAATNHPIDTEFLLNTVSDKNLFLLSEYRREIEKKMPERVGFENSLLLPINGKWQDFIHKQQEYSLLSWNWPDFRNAQYLKRLKNE